MSSTGKKRWHLRVQGYYVRHRHRDKLGGGSFATVYRAENEDGHVVAIKCVRREALNNPKLISNLKSEIQIGLTYRHPRLVQLYDCIDAPTSKHIYLLMEYCDGGDLHHFIEKHKFLPEHAAQPLMRQLAEGLQFFQSKNLIHRDLKPQNLIMTDVDGQRANLKIADFGFARYLSSTSNQNLAATVCGSPLYMAPEVLKGDKYDYKADLYSTGAIFYQMLTGEPPFNATNVSDLQRKIRTMPLNIPKHLKLSPACLDLLSRLLQRDPAKRITYDAFFAHPWIDLPPLEEADEGERERDREKRPTPTVVTAEAKANSPPPSRSPPPSASPTASSERSRRRSGSRSRSQQQSEVEQQQQHRRRPSQQQQQQPIVPSPSPSPRGQNDPRHLELYDDAFAELPSRQQQQPRRSPRSLAGGGGGRESTAFAFPSQHQQQQQQQPRQAATMPRPRGTAPRRSPRNANAFAAPSTLSRPSTSPHVRGSPLSHAQAGSGSGVPIISDSQWRALSNAKYNEPPPRERGRDRDRPTTPSNASSVGVTHRRSASSSRDRARSNSRSYDSPPVAIGGAVDVRELARNAKYNETPRHMRRASRDARPNRSPQHPPMPAAGSSTSSRRSSRPSPSYRPLQSGSGVGSGSPSPHHTAAAAAAGVAYVRRTSPSIGAAGGGAGGGHSNVLQPYSLPPAAQSSRRDDGPRSLRMQQSSASSSSRDRALYGREESPSDHYGGGSGGGGSLPSHQRPGGGGGSLPSHQRPGGGSAPRSISSLSPPRHGDSSHGGGVLQGGASSGEIDDEGYVLVKNPNDSVSPERRRRGKDRDADLYDSGGAVPRVIPHSAPVHRDSMLRDHAGALPHAFAGSSRTRGRTRTHSGAGEDGGFAGGEDRERRSRSRSFAHDSRGSAADYHRRNLLPDSESENYHHRQQPDNDNGALVKPSFYGGGGVIDSRHQAAAGPPPDDPYGVAHQSYDPSMRLRVAEAEAAAGTGSASAAIGHRERVARLLAGMPPRMPHEECNRFMRIVGSFARLAEEAYLDTEASRGGEAFVLYNEALAILLEIIERMDADRPDGDNGASPSQGGVRVVVLEDSGVNDVHSIELPVDDAKKRAALVEKYDYYVCRARAIGAAIDRAGCTPVLEKLVYDAAMRMARSGAAHEVISMHEDAAKNYREAHRMLRYLLDTSCRGNKHDEKILNAFMLTYRHRMKMVQRAI